MLGDREREEDVGGEREREGGCWGREREGRRMLGEGRKCLVDKFAMPNSFLISKNA